MLKLRCQAAAGCKIIVNCFLMAAGRETWQVSKNYIDKIDAESSINDSFKSYFPTLEKLLILLCIARIGIFAISFKRPKTCRLYFYLEILISLLTALAPRHAFQDWDFMAMAYVQNTILNFCLFYCHFLPSVLFTSLVNIAVFCAKTMMFN